MANEYYRSRSRRFYAHLLCLCFKINVQEIATDTSVKIITSPAMLTPIAIDAILELAFSS